MSQNYYLREVENKKEPLNIPCPPINIFQFFCILSRKTPYYHGNSYTNTKTPSSFRVCIISPFFNSIFRQANTPFSQSRQYPTLFYLSTLYYHGTLKLLRESILLPDSTIFSPIAIFTAASKNTKIGVHHPLR